MLTLKHLLAATAFTAIACLAWKAHAHEWYNKKTDPAFGNSCCGGYDCSEAPDGTVFDVQGGYAVVMTLEQAQQVNPMATLPIKAFVPTDRVQFSNDENIHVCIFAHDRIMPRAGVICLFVPMTS